MANVDYSVIEEIEVLREFSSGLLADLWRYKEKQKVSNELIDKIEEEVIDIYNGVLKINTLKEAYITRGKLMIVNESLKKLQ
jgi:hypothetical protein